MRAPWIGLLLLATAACAPAVPDSGAGFGTYDQYAQRGGTAPVGAPLGSPMPAAPVSGFDPARVGAAIDAAETGQTLPPLAPVAPVTTQTAAVIGGGSSGALAADRPRGNAPAGIREESGEMAAVNAGISDEQDFNAVSARETIESDAERKARNAAQYEVVQPTPLPERPGDTGPNIVEFALTTTNNPGEQIYSRSSIRVSSTAAACARYASADQAQEAFLKAGGPKKDGKGLDPDGDGFACDWDPRPFRTALN